jgi:hypothetical protein
MRIRTIRFVAAKESKAARSAADTADWLAQLVKIVRQHSQVIAVNFTAKIPVTH